MDFSASSIPCPSHIRGERGGGSHPPWSGTHLKKNHPFIDSTNNLEITSKLHDLMDVPNGLELEVLLPLQTYTIACHSVVDTDGGYEPGVGGTGQFLVRASVELCVLDFGSVPQAPVSMGRRGRTRRGWPP